MPSPRNDEADSLPGAEFELWHVYDIGGLTQCLKVRYRNETEIPNWHDSLSISDALRAAEVEGWQVYDREPGNTPDEYAIFHLKRERQPSNRLLAR